MVRKKRATKVRLSKKFLDHLKSVTAKRPKTVINHIIEHGFVTTEELSEIYGYDHPPRAARDVRELGIPLVTFRVTGSHGRKIGAYKFGDPTKAQSDRLSGRKPWPKEFKARLIAHYGSRCGICSMTCNSRYLQIDHRVPFEIAGNPTGDFKLQDFMLLCGSCNRAKSWSCEHCENWVEGHLIKTCRSCYWATPGKYTHIALKPVRRLDVVWVGEEAAEYDHMVELARLARKKLPNFVKNVLRERVNKEKLRKSSEFVADAKRKSRG